MAAAERPRMNFKEHADNLGLTEDEYRDMMELFFESGGSDLEKLEAAVAGGDPVRGHAASHSLKGSAGSLALMDIYDLVQAIDEKLRHDELTGVSEMIAGLRKAYDRLAADAKKNL